MSDFFFSFQKLGDDKGRLTFFQKLLVFYKSPISKFYANATGFMLFLCLYAYVVMFDFYYEMSITEQIVTVWIFTYLIEEICEVSFIY